MRLATVLCLYLSLVVSAYADDNVSGRYSGVLSGKKPDGSGPEAKLFLIMVQSGERISCFASLTSFDQDQVACQDVSRNGAEIKFSLPWGAGVILDVTLKGEELNGTIRPAPGVPPGPFNPGPFNVVASKRVAVLTLSDQVPLLTWEAAGPRSPKILQLRKDVLDGRRIGLDTFWQTVEKSGAPIIEPLLGTDQTFLVTFVWKGNSGTTNVLVGWPHMANAYPDGYFMSHVDGTDLWFKMLKVRRGTRIYYQLSPNDPVGVRPDGNWPRRSQADPLNPQRDPDDPKVPLERVRSLLELPGALPQPWYNKRPAVPHYSVKKEESVSSQHLNSERNVLIYTPPGYSEPNPPYPTVYLTDGEDPDGLVFATSTLDNLVADGRIPPVVVVRMVNPDRPTRGRDLTCNDAFLAYVNDELVPFVRRMYNTSRDPLRTLIGGDSLGGLTATCMGLRHPETFGMVLSQSGAYWYKQSHDEHAEPNWVAQQFVEAKKLQLRFYLDAGTSEVDLTGKGEDILLTNRHLRDVLMAKGYEVHYQEFEGDHDWINWRGTLADGLIALLEK